ncbi:MAG: glycosyltransferase family 2 protein [Thermomicrobiales bacterium]
MTSVDLIIPTLNASELLARCLDALRLSTFSDFRLFVFDDGSTVNIASVVHSRFPDANLIRSDQNVGLARAFNLAIAAGSSHYVVLLNNDTEVEPGWLAELVACAERHQEAGSVASKLRLLSDRLRLHSVGDTWSLRGMPGNRGVWLDDVGQYDNEDEVFAACGGAALYRRSAIEKLRQRDGHIFDERLFMYCEDVDIAWRLQTEGWRCVFAPQAVVYHALSATGGGTLASYYVSRNLWLVMSSSVPVEFVRPYRARISAYHLGRTWRTLRHLREPAARASLRGTIAGICLALARSRRYCNLNDGERARILALLTERGHDSSKTLLHS